MSFSAFQLYMFFTKPLMFGRSLSFFKLTPNFTSALMFWYLTRLDYVLNSWVYTTNHKRIAINYFNFVLVSGTAGMSLATVIRLEFAYPGIGILVGDSLQYLSIATAHGVIMVFFMIMPAIFGGFGNFLLPTQLGVHDVAFPRLNSAAFWFLPGGLIMLCQLICIDRRYQRLNCFNMRQLETVLRRQFFTDFLSSGDHHTLMNDSMIGLRFKLNQHQNFQPDEFAFYNLGLLNSNNTYSLSLGYKTQNWELYFSERALTTLVTYYTYASGCISFWGRTFTQTLTSFEYTVNLVLNSLYITLTGAPQSLTSSVKSTPLSWQLQHSLLKTVDSYSPLAGTLPTHFRSDFTTVNPLMTKLFRLNSYTADVNLTEYPLSSTVPMGSAQNHPFTFEQSLLDQGMAPLSTSDSVDSGRFVRFSNPMIEYEYRKGTYFTVWADRFPNLMTSMIELGRNEYFAKWFKSKPFKALFAEDINYFSDNFTNTGSTKGRDLSTSWYSSHVRPTTNILNIVQGLQVNNSYLNPTLWYGFPKKLTSYWSKADPLLSPDKLSPLLVDNFISMGTKVLHFPFFNRTKQKNHLLNQNILFAQLQKSESASVLRPWVSPTIALRRVGLPDTVNFSDKSTATEEYFLTQSWFIKKHFFGQKTNWFNRPATGGDLRFPRCNWLLFTELRSLSPSRLIKFNPSTLSLRAVDLTGDQPLATGVESAFQFRWSSNAVLKQKYYRLFTSDSTQQRVVANWRELKFTREAWRCKLLVARHQTALFRRFTSEDSLFWAIERNAKDLLPGWAMITPFSSRTRYTAVGKTDIGLMAVFIVLNSSIVSSANFLITYRYLSTLNNRKMRDARSFFTEGLITASWMMVAANPMLMIGIIMLLSDRHWQTSFFDYSGGGDAILFQHMFWFFGHPEVYVIMLPVFGYVNTILSFYLRKRISARGSLLYSMYTIAFLGFFVWGHHMYMVGLSHTTRMLFSTLTVMISVPAATKLMHWSVTVVNSFFTLELPLLFTLTFIFFFVSGGVSGMYVANTGMDVLFHDTFYVIGHFHVMFAGSAMIGIFAAFYFYFPALYGVKYSRVYGYIHYTYYIIGQLMTVIPMLWLGYCGQPRRVLDYPSAFGSWHSISSAGHLLSVAAMLSFFIMIYDSVRQSKPAVRNTFGVGRFNTRLNFYLFEIYRLKFTQQKNFIYKRLSRTNSSQKSRKVATYLSDQSATRDKPTWLFTLRPTNVNTLLLKSFETSTVHYVWMSKPPTIKVTLKGTPAQKKAQKKAIYRAWFEADTLMTRKFLKARFQPKDSPQAAQPFSSNTYL